MRVLQAPGGLKNVVGGLADRQAALFADHRPQVLSLDKFHHQVMAGIALAGIVSHHNVRVDKLSCGFDLAVKALESVGRAHGRAGDHFHGDGAPMSRCSALSTTPMPPSPSLSTTRYSPKTSPLIRPS